MNNTTAEILEITNDKIEVKAYENITFAQPLIHLTDRSINLKMDILKPQIDKKLPVVLFIPGGGFLRSNKASFIQQRLALAEKGYLVASMEYRTVPNGKFPDALVDVKSAIRFLKANAEKYGLSRNNIAVMGDSAGGYLAALAGTTNNHTSFDIGDFLEENSNVNAVIDLYGLSNLGEIAKDFSEETKEKHQSPASSEYLFLNGTPPFDEVEKDLNKSIAKSDPATYISADTPPFLLMHGDKDQLVSPSQTEYLYDALQDSGIEAKRYVVKNAEHGGAYWVQPQIINIMTSFLNEHLT
ncbi:alpha/beta hydrolase [Zunongwangia sp. HRR-M8]|uniref:alpha/beta hydrolase n=1 Tax=Zunongwangia sp. HRR-M8 TaxID=3015170 RepID=UPI0022DE17CD|nr:alpha/beta hydrolase [Zunongwangia sp. HRR-M8]WBL21568.1 alpha/beta hydrolase [Zunongwangia sp. HRR-M8]